MELTDTNNQLLQLKIDFIQLAAQTGKLLGYDPQLYAIQYALLLENTYVTVDKIMQLTGLRKRVVSAILSDLADPASNFHILKTRKPREKAKYYKVSTNYKQYIQNILAIGFRAFTSNIEAIPLLISRLNQLNQQDESNLHIQNFLTFFYQIMNCYAFFVEYSSRHVNDLFSNPEFMNSIEEELELIFNEKIPLGQSDLIPTKDSLVEVKKDWLSYLRDFFAYSSTMGKKRIEANQVIVLHTLNLENKPLNQTQIMKMTGFSRGSVSEILTELVNTSAVRVIKKGKDRKKYFTLNVKISDLIIAKYTKIRSIYTQVYSITERQFLVELGKLEISEDIKSHLEEFFREIIKLYRIAEEHLSVLLNFIRQKENG